MSTKIELLEFAIGLIDHDRADLSDTRMLLDTKPHTTATICSIFMRRHLRLSRIQRLMHLWRFPIPPSSAETLGEIVKIFEMYDSLTPIEESYVGLMEDVINPVEWHSMDACSNTLNLPMRFIFICIPSLVYRTK